MPWQRSNQLSYIPINLTTYWTNDLPVLSARQAGLIPCMPDLFYYELPIDSMVVMRAVVHVMVFMDDRVTFAARNQPVINRYGDNEGNDE